MLEPIVKTGNVTDLYKEIILAALEDAITSTQGYEAYTRLNVGQITKEQAFQWSSGMVNDAERKKLGVMTGCELICISELSGGENIFIKSSLIHIETGKIIASPNELLTRSESKIYEGCQKLAKKLVGGKVASNTESGSSSGGSANNTSGNQTASNTGERGVLINGVRWATCNVAAPGTFAAKPEDAGMFYQWNRRKAWPVTGKVSGWDSSKPTGSVWTKANDPSPAGWRVPTLDEVKKLLDKDKVNHKWTTVNGVKGRRFTDKATGNSIFLPAVGCRYSDGTLDEGYLRGDGTPSGLKDGYYWSGTQYDNALGFCYEPDYAGLNNCYESRRGYSVRPVADN